MSAALRTWLVAAADGDRSALAPLFAELAPVVRAYCGRMLRGASSAEDAAQDALVDIFRRLREYDPTRPPLGWALGLATWQCRTHARRTYRRREISADAAPEPTGSPVDELLDRDLIAAALATLATLPPDDIATLTADILDGARDEHVAAPTLRKRLERARLRLRTAWRARHGTN